MLRPMLEFLLIHYHVSPAVFWIALSVATLVTSSWLILLGLCRVSGEADDRADQMLAHLKRHQVP